MTDNGSPQEMWEDEVTHFGWVGPVPPMPERLDADR